MFGRCSSTNPSLSADGATADRAARRQRWIKGKEGQGGGVAAPASQVIPSCSNFVVGGRCMVNAGGKVTDGV